MPVEARVSIYSMFLCGLRVGEATSMQSDWVSPSQGGLSIAVPSETSSDGVFKPKTAAGVRVTPVPSSFTDHLTGDEIELEFADVLRSYFELNNEVGCGVSAVRRWLFEAADAAGLEEWRPVVERTFGRELVLEAPDVIAHDGRASWCAQCLRSDVNRYTVRDWGGWSDMTMINRYADYVGDPSGEQIARF